jgi:phosphohistidine phosphatase SixA
MSSTVHVVRHGEVENPNKILYGRQPGWGLSARGQEMAQTLGDWSRTIDLGALHVSPLQRAQETAAPIAAAHKIAITTDERLIEAANIFEGKPFGVGDGVLKHPSSWVNPMINKSIECWLQSLLREMQLMAKMQSLFHINFQFGF